MADESLDGQPEEREIPLTPHVEDDSDDAAALIAEVQTNEKGDKFVSLGTHIGMRKEAKQAKREIAELKARLADQDAVNARLDEVLPIAEAVKKDPELGKLIRQTLDGTRQTRPTTEQPADDPEALEYAQVLGLVTKDKDGNDVYDVARAARALDIESSRAQKRMQPHLDAANEAAFGMRGEQNLAALYRMETPSGELVASDESIKEVMRESQMPMKMLADPRVARTVGLMAAGLDREKGRTPKAPLEPMYLERPGSRRAGSTQISDNERRVAGKVGLTDEDLQAVGKMKVSRKQEVDLE